MGRSTWLQGVSCVEKMVMVAIADVADDNGLAYMLTTTLMAKTSCSRRTVQTALVSLGEKNLLLRRTRKNRSSVFKIVVTNIPMGRPDQVSDRELSDDHFWDNDRGASPAPHVAAGQNAGDADENAAAADESAGDAPIHPVIHPVTLPVLPHSPQGGGEGQDLFGNEPAPIAATDQDFADLYVTMWNDLSAKIPKLTDAKPLRDENVKSLMARLREAKAAKSIDDARALLESLFAQFEGSRLLRGEGDRGWVPAATWLLGKRNFGKVIDGFYVQDAAAGADRPKSRDERSFMDAGLAARDILRARDRAAPQTLRQIAGLDPRSPSYDRR